MRPFIKNIEIRLFTVIPWFIHQRTIFKNVRRIQTGNLTKITCLAPFFWGNGRKFALEKFGIEIKTSHSFKSHKIDASMKQISYSMRWLTVDCGKFKVVPYFTMEKCIRRAKPYPTASLSVLLSKRMTFQLLFIEIKRGFHQLEFWEMQMIQMVAQKGC